MPNDFLHVYQALYQNDTSCVLIFDRTQTLVWHNGRPAPFDLSGDLPSLLHFPEDALPHSGDYTLDVHGESYAYHLTCDGGDYCIANIDNTPLLQKLMHDKKVHAHLENLIAEQRQESFGIANAVSELNELVEDADMPIPEQPLYSKLDIVMGCCAHLMRHQFVLSELMKYNEPAETQMENECVDCACVLEYFRRMCSQILKSSNSIRILCHAEPNLMLAVSPQRLEFCLLCILLLLRGDDTAPCRIKINAAQAGDTAAISFMIEQTGESDDMAHLHSTFAPLHDVPTLYAERMILKEFCAMYDAVIMETHTQDVDGLVLRIPLADMPPGMHLRMTRAERTQGIITMYHAMLSRLVDYRYY